MGHGLVTGTTGLCEYCDKENIQFLSDEIYHHISYGKKEATALQYSKSALIINCKCHDMPPYIPTLDASTRHCLDQTHYHFLLR
jgi:hypothetical protein